MAEQNPIGDINEKVTAVDVLWENLTSLFFFTDGIPIEAMDRYNQAKQMEKQQIVNAHLTGLVYPLEMDASKQAEEYYEDNYKK